MKNLGLPIKYAIQPLFQDKGGRKEIGYIVSKAYVVKEIKEYSTGGNCSTHYNVVFPYRNINNYELLEKRVNPKFRKVGYYDKICINTNFVREIYENYNEAKMICNIMNAPFENKKDEIQKLEDKITDKTKDLNITKND